MAISRRRFLQAATFLQGSTLYSSSSLASEDSGSRECGFDGPDKAIEKFLDKTYGHGKWYYAPAPVLIRIPFLVENPNVIPLEIRVFDSYAPGYSILDLYVHRLPTSSISWVAKFQFGKGTLPEIETRIRVLDSLSFKLIVVFSYEKEYGDVPVIVVKMNGKVNVAG